MDFRALHNSLIRPTHILHLLQMPLNFQCEQREEGQLLSNITNTNQIWNGPFKVEWAQWKQTNILLGVCPFLNRIVNSPPMVEWAQRPQTFLQISLHITPQDKPKKIRKKKSKKCASLLDFLSILKNKIKINKIGCILRGRKIIWS